MCKYMLGQRERNSLILMKRDGTGEYRMERNSFLCVYPAASPEIIVKSQPVLPLRVMSGSMVIQQESVLIFVAHITTGDHV